MKLSPGDFPAALGHSRGRGASVFAEYQSSFGVDEPTGGMAARKRNRRVGIAMHKNIRLAMAACAVAVVTGAAVVAGAQTNVAQVVQQRQELMEQMLRANSRQIIPMMRAENREPWNAQTAVQVMTLLRDNAARIATLFPEGSGPQAGIETRALPTIWQRKAEFDGAARTLSTRASQMLALAQANDEAGFRQGWTTFFAEGCVACHRPFAGPGVPGNPRQ